MRTRKAPQYGSWSAARFACAAAVCVATSAVAQVSTPKKREAPPSPPTSGSVVSYQELPSAGIVYHEEKGGLVSAVASPVKPGNGAAAAPAAAPTVATTTARKAPTTPGKVAQAPTSPERARP